MMNKFFKKIFCIFIAASILLINLSVAGYAAVTSGFCGNGVAWSFSEDDGILEISGGGRMFDYSASSPAPWYAFRERITQVELENGVEYIGDYSFYGLTRLAYVNADLCVKEVGESAFYGTFWLEISAAEFVTLNGILIRYNGSSQKINLPENITGISSDAFKSNKNITEIVSDYYIDTVSSEAFSDCTALNKVHFNSVKRICDYAFSGCTSLYDICLSNDVEFIGSSCFENTKWLDDFKEDFAVAGNILISYKGNGGFVQIPDGIAGIADAFYSDSSVETVVIPDSVKYIGEYAFESCSELRCVIFGDQLETIGNEAFYDCGKITTLFLPNTLKKIDDSAFEHCSSLSLICLPEGLETIGSYSFTSCSSLETVILPNSLRAVGNNAFINCTELKNVFSNSRLTTFGSHSVGFNILNVGIKKSNSIMLRGADNSALHGYALDNALTFVTDNCVHNMSITNVSSACDCFGYDLSECSECGYFEVSGIEEPSSHSFSQWADNGECFERLCSICGQKEYDGILYGDMDRDGKIDGMDSVIADAIRNGMDVFDSNGVLPKAADCNRNETVDENDVYLIAESGLFVEFISQNR